MVGNSWCKKNYVYKYFFGGCLAEIGWWLEEYHEYIGCEKCVKGE